MRRIARRHSQYDSVIGQPIGTHERPSRRSWTGAAALSRDSDSTQAASRLSSIERSTVVALGGILVLGGLLRGARLAEAPGGYHAWNEAYYIGAGLANARRGLLAWFVNPTEVNKPPLYQGLVSMLYRLDLPTVASARCISVLAGLVTIVVVFLLGRLLFNERTGLIAAALLAVTPGAVLVDHNIQTDSLMIALVFGSIYFYVLAIASRRAVHGLVGGILLGLGVLTKQPSVLVLPALAAWETWRARGASWVHERRVWWYWGSALVLGTSWYLMQLAVARERLVAGMFGVIGPKGAGPVRGWPLLENLLAEYWWMLFPATALLALAALAYCWSRRRAGDKLLIVLAIVYTLFFGVFHYHTYYLVPLAPILALAVGRLYSGLIAPRILRRWIRIALVGALLAVMTLASVLMLGGQKWGQWSPMNYDRSPAPGFDAVHLYYDPWMIEVYGPGMNYLPRRLTPTLIETDEFFKTAEVPGVESLLLTGELSDASGKPFSHIDEVSETWVRPVVFGRAIGQRRSDDLRLGAVQFFKNSPWTVERVGPSWRFGLESTPVTSSLLIYNRESFPGR